MKITKEIVFLSALLLICAYSLFMHGSRLFDNQTGRMPLHALSYPFESLTPIFKNVPRAGYYTDKPLEHPMAIAQFELAQYVLTPTLLVLQNTTLPLVIIDATSQAKAMDIAQNNNLKTLSTNNAGIILATPQGHSR